MRRPCRVLMVVLLICMTACGSAAADGGATGSGTPTPIPYPAPVGGLGHRPSTPVQITLIAPTRGEVVHGTTLVVKVSITGGAAPYAVRIVSPAPGADVGAPLTLTVCGVAASGRLVPATSAQYYLAVIVDGAQAPTVDVWHVPVELSSGTHTVEVELVSPGHQAFNPPATFTETVTVLPGAPPAGPGSC